jgi:hypothetical protein
MHIKPHTNAGYAHNPSGLREFHTLNPSRGNTALKHESEENTVSKAKTFVSVIPYQGKNQKTGEDMLQPVLYKPHGNVKLAYSATRFPIVPAINGYAERGDKVRVIAILTEGEDYKHNYECYFVPEIDMLVRDKSLDFSGVEVINTADSEDIDTQLKLFSDIIDAIGDSEDIYACITYGTKPTPIVETMALNYAYRLKKDVSVGCIVYGRFINTNPTSDKNGIYDTTALFYMDSIVNELANHGASNPEKAIRIMLGLENTEEAEDE